MLLYLKVVAPCICSLWSLEAASANASDVFIFWLAIASVLRNLLSKDVNETGISVELAKEISDVFNSRYQAFFSTSNIYFVAFTLDPR